MSALTCHLWQSTGANFADFISLITNLRKLLLNNSLYMMNVYYSKNYVNPLLAINENYQLLQISLEDGHKIHQT